MERNIDMKKIPGRYLLSAEGRYLLFFAARMLQKKEDHGLLIRLSVKDSGQERIQKRIRERRI